MKRAASAILVLLMLATTSQMNAACRADSPNKIETWEDLPKDTDALYRQPNGQDGAYTSLGSTMFGWGIGLAVGIGILTAMLKQSKAPSTTTPTTGS
jgi:hypothetical protein